MNVFQAVVQDDVASTSNAYDASTKRSKLGISSQLEKYVSRFIHFMCVSFMYLICQPDTTVSEIVSTV